MPAISSDSCALSNLYLFRVSTLLGEGTPCRHFLAHGGLPGTLKLSSTSCRGETCCTAVGCGALSREQAGDATLEDLLGSGFSPCCRWQAREAPPLLRLFLDVGRMSCWTAQAPALSLWCSPGCGEAPGWHSLCVSTEALAGGGSIAQARATGPQDEASRLSRTLSTVPSLSIDFLSTLHTGTFRLEAVLQKIWPTAL